MSSPNRPVLGVFWMFVTGVCFVAVTALVKYLGSDMPAAESAFLRYFIGLVFLLPILWHQRGGGVSGRRLTWHGLRGLVHSLGVILWFFAMTRISIAEVTAMNYLSPVYVTIGAAVFLGERLAARRIAAVVAAFLGAMIILRPGFRALDDGHVAMLAAAAFFSVSYILGKKFADEMPASTVVAMLSVTVTIGLFPFALAVWVPPTLGEVLILGFVAFFATAGHYTMTLSFANAPVTVTQPVTFLQLVWATTMGAVFFAEPADVWVILGGAVILSSVTFITWREAVLRRAGIAPSVNAPKS